ncbi:hypothetical protein OPV22_000944 [Ensete ventricosum]|uniref:FHA domain-containing protein n=1 Tax=Ensete ventricosum TaxID=4639 RepID=A0AAV8RQF0_ENSVE|nr:hypothetical protein OPV22_000944 [Ensete ventricosum]RWW63123.1 hypothetical protein BHE74_00029720 [Ensete ventricosum]
MAREESERSLVGFSAEVEGKGLKLRSEVVNGTYASSHRLAVGKVVRLGLAPKIAQGKSSVYVNGVKIGSDSKVSIAHGNNGRFSFVGVKGLWQRLGEESELELEINYQM